MDCERLITEVYSRRALWDVSHPQHHHRGVLDKSWAAVSKSMRASVRDVRHKWKYLRDHFRKELKKFPNGMSKSGYEPTWPYFNLLHFLKDQIIIRDNDDSSSSQTNEDSQSISVKVETEEIDIFDDQVSDDAKPFMRALKRPTSNNSPVNPKHQRLEDRDQSSSNNLDELSDDYHFFMSLLPTMKKFNDLQKMRVRSKFQQTILEELSQMEEYQNS
ncbi:transcription factor Adf-1 [Anoplophora glabripennis]|nr:transcription factor Adf-1 [Anoplophora glabripennis]